MKKKKFLLSVLCVFITIDTFGQAKWTPLTSSFQMQIAVVVKDGGSAVNSDQIEIGAFTNDGCRASSFLFDGTGLYGSYVAFLTVNGVSNESITFRVYNHATNSEYETTHAPLNFANTAMIGFPPSPAFEITLNASPVLASPPAPPGSFTATPGDGQVLLNWTIPTDGGSPISGYEISWGTTAGYTTSWSIPLNHVSILNHTIPLLTNSIEYKFEVRAINAHGQSGAAGPVTATPGPVTTYPITLPSSIILNGVTAEASATLLHPANATVPVTIFLYGIATAAGTHTVGLTSDKLGPGISAPGAVTRTVSAGENITSGHTFEFSFTMPAEAVSDLVLTHTFIADVTFSAVQTGGTSSVANTTGIEITFSDPVAGLGIGDITINNGSGVIATGALTGSGDTYSVAVTSVTTQGNVTVSIADFDDYSVTNSPQTVAVYKDVTPPVLSSGSVNRTSPLAGTIEFDTDEAGTAYYLVQDVSDAAPTPGDVVLTGTSPGSVVVGTNSGLPVVLTAGPKVIYVEVEDAEGNISNMLAITAAANLSGATVTQSLALTYNGGLQTPTFCVSFDGGVTCLNTGTDYTVTVTLQTNAGTYTGTDAATITGIGNYSGTITAAFTIDKSQVTVTQGGYVVTKAYDGSVSAGAGSGPLGISGIVDATTVNATPGVYPNANAGTHTITIGLTLSNDANHELVSNTLTITDATITPATFGTQTANANVPETGSTNNTVILPALAAGANYPASITVSGTFINGTFPIGPSGAGFILTFDASANAPSNTETITILVGSSTNYNSYNVIVTVTWQAVALVQENTPTASIDFTNELLINLAAGEDYTIDDGVVTPVTANASGNIPIQAGWMGISIDIIKLGVGSNLASAAQTLAIPARPAAPTATKTDTSGGLTNGELNNVDPSMEFKLSSASGWTAISGTDVTSLAAGTYLVRYMATAVDFASDEATLVIAASSPPATTPTAPQNFTAIPGDSEVRLSWSAPTSDGGSPITSYEVSSDNGVTWVTASSSTGHVFTGLVNGTSYTFCVRARNAVGAGAEVTAIATPVVGITTTLYNINIEYSLGGYISAYTMTAAEDETVTLTITPTANHVLFSLSVFLSADTTISVPLDGTGLTRTFTMPAGDVTVKAIFVNISYEARWEAARVIIESNFFNILQEKANTTSVLRYHLADLINELIKETGFNITYNDIVVFDYNFKPAVAGIAENRAGVNGSFEFRVSPSGSTNPAYSGGIITATPYDMTDNELLEGNITTWIQNNQLHVTGLSQGKPLHLYNLTGILLYKTVASGNKLIIPLPERGLYILVTDERRIKIVN